MKTIEVLREPSLPSVLIGALASSTKRPGVVKKLPPVTLVRPEVVLDGAHIARTTRCAVSRRRRACRCCTPSC